MVHTHKSLIQNYKIGIQYGLAQSLRETGTQRVRRFAHIYEKKAAIIRTRIHL